MSESKRDAGDQVLPAADPSAFTPSAGDIWAMLVQMQEHVAKIPHVLEENKIIRAEQMELRQRVLQTSPSQTYVQSSETHTVDRSLFPPATSWPGDAIETPLRDPVTSNNIVPTFNVDAHRHNERRSSGIIRPDQQLVTPARSPASISFTQLVWNKRLTSTDYIEIYNFSRERDIFVQNNAVAAKRVGLPGLWANLDTTIQQELNSTFPNVKDQAGDGAFDGDSDYGWAYMSDRFMFIHLNKLNDVEVVLIGSQSEGEQH